MSDKKDERSVSPCVIPEDQSVEPTLDSKGSKTKGSKIIGRQKKMEVLSSN